MTIYRMDDAGVAVEDLAAVGGMVRVLLQEMRSSMEAHDQHLV